MMILQRDQYFIHGAFIDPGYSADLSKAKIFFTGFAPNKQNIKHIFG